MALDVIAESDGSVLSEKAEEDGLAYYRFARWILRSFQRRIFLVRSPKSTH